MNCYDIIVMSKMLMVLVGFVVVLAVIGFTMRDKPDLAPKAVRPSSAPTKVNSDTSTGLSSAPSVQNTLAFSQFHAITTSNVLTPVQINFRNILTGKKG